MRRQFVLDENTTLKLIHSWFKKIVVLEGTLFAHGATSNIDALTIQLGCVKSVANQAGANHDNATQKADLMRFCLA